MRGRRIGGATYQDERWQEAGWRRLVAAVCIRAIEDWQRGDMAAKRWLEREGRHWLAWLDIDAGARDLAALARRGAAARWVEEYRRCYNKAAVSRIKKR